MEEFSLSYREVIPDQTNPQVWKDIVLNTGKCRRGWIEVKVSHDVQMPNAFCDFWFCFDFKGATQSTLQDIKVVEKAGGYYYNDTSNIYNRNRFIYW